MINLIGCTQECRAARDPLASRQKCPNRFSVFESTKAFWEQSAAADNICMSMFRTRPSQVQKPQQLPLILYHNNWRALFACTSMCQCARPSLHTTFFHPQHAYHKNVLLLRVCLGGWYTHGVFISE